MGESLREAIYKKIRDQITYGELLPGERLTEANLIDKFEASRSTFREAIGQLESEGLIKREQNKGISVSKLSLEEVQEIYVIRELLEGFATRLMAQKATKKQAEYLDKIHNNLIMAAKEIDLEKWLTNNSLFHHFIIHECENKNLICIIEILQRRIYRYRVMIAQIPKSFNCFIGHHEKILLAIRKKDGEMAEKFMRLHIESNKVMLSDWMQRLPAFQKTIYSI